MLHFIVIKPDAISYSGFRCASKICLLWCLMSARVGIAISIISCSTSSPVKLYGLYEENR